MEVLELIEKIRSEDASVDRLFKREGHGIRGGKNSEYMTKLAEAAEFYADVLDGKVPFHRLQEAMTTSDFPTLFADVVDRQMLGVYNETPQTFRNYARVSTVRDFRTVKRYFVNGSEAALAPVAEQDEYPESQLDDGKYSYSVSKFGRRIPISWETLMNDDLQALQDLPDRLGRAARRSEEKFATDLFVGTTGPDATFFSNTNKNLVNIANGAVTDNPILSIAALQDAFTVLSKQTDVDGEPIYIETVELVVPPALQVTALNILNATELWLNEKGGTTNQQVHVANWMKNKVRLNVNYYLPVIATTNGATAWYMFANPSVGRPAMEVGFLRGHDQPEIFVKEPNQRRIGGGAVNPTDGDFLNDSVEWKLRHVFGGTLMDPKMAVASRGTGVA